MPFQFRDDIVEIKDVQPEMSCPGIVTNVTNFGAFVDIGVHQGANSLAEGHFFTRGRARTHSRGVPGEDGGVTIHQGHPFLPPEGERSAVRRLRGRWPSGVAIVTTGEERSRVGLTVSSLLVVDGDPGVAVMMLDALSDLAEALDPDTPCVVNVLGPGQHDLAEVFAGQAPAPGGPFTVGRWHQGAHGPELVGAAAVARGRVSQVADHETGFAVRHEVTLEAVDLSDVAALRHERGSYL